MRRIFGLLREWSESLSYTPPPPPLREMGEDEREWLIRIQQAELNGKRLTGADVPCYIGIRLGKLGEMRWVIHGHYTQERMLATPTWKTTLVDPRTGDRRDVPGEGQR